MEKKDSKNYLHQLKWQDQLKKCNKEKEMQQEIMELKEENRILKRQINNFSEWMWILARQVKEANQKVEYMKEHFIPVND